MPLRLVMTALVAAGLAAQVRGQDDRLPYRAYINSDDVYVRSGPGQNYYPVLRLKRGDTVDVYRHDPGGWYAIRPPAGSFSWISAEFVQPGDGRMGTVVGDRVVARVGTAFSDVRDVIQVRLDQGEEIEILEAKRFGNGPGAQTWYRITPPAGEFRWISGKFIDTEPPQREVRRRDEANNLLVARHASSGREEDGEEDRDARPARRARSRPRDEQDRDDADDAPRDDGSSGSWRRSTAPRAADDLTAADTAPPRRGRTDDDAERVLRAAAADDVTPRRSASARGDQDLLSALDDVDMELSALAARKPPEWDLQPLRARTDALMQRCDTALDRGRVRLVQRKIARFEEIKQRHDTVMSGPAGGATGLARSVLGPGSPASMPAVSRYDGIGKLAQVQPGQSGQTGVAGFALLDRQGKISHYVTPAPGVNLRQYVGREVGLSGTLGYMSDARTQHVTAKRITVVDGTLLR